MLPGDLRVLLRLQTRLIPAQRIALPSLYFVFYIHQTIFRRSGLPLHDARGVCERQADHGEEVLEEGGALRRGGCPQRGDERAQRAPDGGDVRERLVLRRRGVVRCGEVALGQMPKRLLENVVG